MTRVICLCVCVDCDTTKPEKWAWWCVCVLTVTPQSQKNKHGCVCVCVLTVTPQSQRNEHGGVCTDCGTAKPGKWMRWCVYCVGHCGDRRRTDPGSWRPWSVWHGHPCWQAVPLHSAGWHWPLQVSSHLPGCRHQQRGQSQHSFCFHALQCSVSGFLEQMAQTWKLVCPVNENKADLLQVTLPIGSVIRFSTNVTDV